MSHSITTDNPAPRVTCRRKRNRELRGLRKMNESTKQENSTEVGGQVDTLVRHRPGMEGCSDSNCIFQDNSHGMHTNGGCRCEKELMRTPNGRKAVMAIRYLQRRQQKAQGARDMLREAAKQFRCAGDDGHARMCDIHADDLESA